MSEVQQSWDSLSDAPGSFPLMKFTLAFSGKLSPSGNKPKPENAWVIRNELHKQLAVLWETSAPLRNLKRSAKVALGHGHAVAQDDAGEPLSFNTAGGEFEKDLCAPVIAKNGWQFVPLVRKSLHLACEIDILFLRPEEPGSLRTQDGDLDNRIKTLFDALRMPEGDELKCGVPDVQPLYCALESDSLITAFKVRSERLLVEPEASKNVQLVMDVTIQVLRPMLSNLPLVGR